MSLLFRKEGSKFDRVVRSLFVNAFMFVWFLDAWQHGRVVETAVYIMIQSITIPALIYSLIDFVTK